MTFFKKRRQHIFVISFPIGVLFPHTAHKVKTCIGKMAFPRLEIKCINKWICEICSWYLYTANWTFVLAPDLTDTLLSNIEGEGSGTFRCQSRWTEGQGRRKLKGTKPDTLATSAARDLPGGRSLDSCSTKMSLICCFLIGCLFVSVSFALTLPIDESSRDSARK